MNNLLKHEHQTATDQEIKSQKRRDFLKKSAVVAYSTPVLMSILVNNASASDHSWKDSIDGPARDSIGGSIGDSADRGRRKRRR